jgi:general secretion pathway protein G
MKLFIRIFLYGTLVVLVYLVLYTSPGGVFSGNQKAVAKLFVTQDMATSLLTYKQDTGDYPTTRQGFMALIKAPAGVQGWHGPYLRGNNVPTDPWRNPYHYHYPGIHNPNGYDVWSSGPDGIADDIGNW